jgi:hypothetical protein
MSHYNRDYTNELDADTAAIADIQEYLSDKQWNRFMELVLDDEVTCQQIDFYLHFTGISGFPVFAFMRRFRAAEYQAWFDALPD